VRIIGEFMIASGEATPYHLDGRLEKEPRHGTWITEDVALPGRVKISERLGETARPTLAWIAAAPDTEVKPDVHPKGRTGFSQ
jgi:hypothetical protein